MSKKATAISGTAPAESDIVEAVVHDPARGVFGALNAQRAAEGTDSFGAVFNQEELDRLIEEGNISQLDQAVDVHAGDLALYAGSELQKTLRDLEREPIWPPEMTVVHLAQKPDVHVGFGPRDRLDAIRRGWAEALKKEADAAGVRYAMSPEGPHARIELERMERLCHLAIDCEEIGTQLAYELWLRIAFSQRRRFETVLFRRSYELAIQPDYGCSWETFTRDVEDLADHFAGGGRDTRPNGRPDAANVARHLEQTNPAKLPDRSKANERPFLKKAG